MTLRTKLARYLIAALCLAPFALPTAAIFGIACLFSFNFMGLPFLACTILWVLFVYDTVKYPTR